MRIFASKTASIAAIKRKNKQFAEWWNRWAVRNRNTQLRVATSEAGGEGTAQGTEPLHFRDVFRLRKILEERGQ
jgi:hypothetical protein